MTALLRSFSLSSFSKQRSVVYPCVVCTPASCASVDRRRSTDCTIASSSSSESACRHLRPENNFDQKIKRQRFCCTILLVHLICYGVFLSGMGSKTARPNLFDAKATFFVLIVVSRSRTVVEAPISGSRFVNCAVLPYEVLSFPFLRFGLHFPILSSAVNVTCRYTLSPSKLFAVVQQRY